MKLKGKVALVSGGHRGIGEAVVRRFAAEGAHVGLADIAAKAGEELAAKLTEAGHSVEFIKLDVTKAIEWDAAVKALMNRHGRLDILVNNAGIFQRKPMHEISEEEWRVKLEQYNFSSLMTYNLGNTILKEVLDRELEGGK